MREFIKSIPGTTKAIMGIFTLAVALTVLLLAYAAKSTGNDVKPTEATVPTSVTASSANNGQSNNTLSTTSINISTTAPLTNVTATAGSTAAVVTVPVQTAAPQLEDPSSWNRAKTLSVLTEAVNKTKAYTNPLTVRHAESFTADITECTGGSLVKTLANTMMGWVVKPVDETLSYSGGKAVNVDGETIPIILPKRGNFTLSEGGIVSSSASLVNNEYVIKMSIVKERVGMYDVPPNNAASIGYLDVTSLDLSVIEVTAADITYLGSSFEIHINRNGYVTYAEYHIPLHVAGGGKRGSLSGNAVFDGEQIEVWQLYW